MFWTIVIAVCTAGLGYIYGVNKGFKLGYTMGVEDFKAYLEIMSNPARWIKDHKDTLPEGAEAKILDFAKRVEADKGCGGSGNCGDCKGSCHEDNCE